MKRIIPVFIFAFMLTLPAFSQQFNAGFRLGVNGCQIDGDGMSGYNLAGVVGGVFVSYPINKKWDAQFELLYSQKGSARYISADSMGPGPWDFFRINYLEVPLMANYRVSEKLKINMGLGGALMVSNHFEGRANYIVDNYDIVTKGEFNGLLGFQYFITPKLAVYGRLTYSLWGINKPNSALSSYVNATSFYIFDGGMANNVISVGGYYCLLGSNSGK